MKEYNHIEQVNKESRVVVLGNFDGVHLGHRELLKEARKKADELQCSLMVFTFYPQWQAKEQSDFGYLATQERKKEIFAAFGVDEVLSIPFEPKIARVTPQDFIQTILAKDLQAIAIVVGYNYTFGYRAQGNVALLKEMGQRLGIETIVVEPYCIDGKIVSSSLIRTMLQEGKTEAANVLLGSPFSYRGEVVYGRQVGRTIGIPTANIQTDETLVRPAIGVYAAKVLVGEERHWGILNIGKRPTVNNGDDISVEVHILDFDQDIYGKVIEVQLLEFYRGESKFTGLDDLKGQIKKDIARLRLQVAKDKWKLF